MEEKGIGKGRILLPKPDISKMAHDLNRELMKLLPYDFEAREELICRYIQNVQERIKENIKNFVKNVDEPDGAQLLGMLFQDAFEDSLV